MQKESAREGYKPPQVLSNYLRRSRNSYCQRAIDCIAIGFSTYYFNQALSHSELSDSGRCRKCRSTLECNHKALIDYLRLSLTLASIRCSNRNSCYNRHEYSCSIKNRRFIPISNSRKWLIGRSCANAATQFLLECGQERGLICHRSSG